MRLNTIYDESSAVFIDEKKTTIRVNAIEKTLKGESTFERIIVVSPTPVFEEFQKQVSLELVEENTNNWLNSIKAEQDEYSKIIIKKVKDEIGVQDVSSTFNPATLTPEDIFKIKLQAFEIEEVKNSKNRELKAKIRKAGTFMEVLAYTSALVNSEL